MEETIKFNINDVLKKNEDINIDKETYDLAENIVINKLINQKENSVESDKYNKILAECIIGKPSSIKQIKEFITQYLRDSNKFNENQIEKLKNLIYVNNFGLSVIDDLVSDKTINEIWVNGPEHIWIEKNGIKTRLDRKFRNNDEIIRIMRQMLQFDKKEINPRNPIVESKMLDGSRITFIIPPASSKPCINIRKFSAFDTTEENLLKEKTISLKQLDLLKAIVKGRANILIIGETSAGKTSFLKFLSDYINPKLRLGTIESNFELKLGDKYPNRNIFEYEEHEELGITLGKLFKLCLRSSPDIIFLGEARGSEEAEALINSMRRGHEGSIGTIHTNNAQTAIDDIEDMILQDGKKRDPMLLRDRIINAVEIIIQIHRFGNGKRKVVKITEVIPIKDENSYGKYRLNDIWAYDEKQDDFFELNKISRNSLIRKMSFYGLSENEIKKVI